MASLGTYGDSLRICWTGERGGADAYDPAASIGGERLGETVHVKAIIDNPIPPIRLRGFGALTATGTGYLTSVDADSLSYSAPGDDYGAAVTIANGETALLVSADGESTLRVERVSADDLGGTATLTVIPQTGGALGMSNITRTQMNAGEDYYRALMLHNAGTVQITNLKLWVNPLSSAFATDVQQLPSSVSAGVSYQIETGTANAFADWPSAGWANIYDTTGGTVREVVYYYARTSVRLYVTGVDSTGRLGTTHSAGASNDTITLVPGIRIAKETPSSGSIQRVADQYNAPTGLTWDVGTSSAEGLSEATFAADAELGLWIHKEIPNAFYDSVLGPKVENSIGCEWTVGGVTYSGTLSEFYAGPWPNSVTGFNTYIAYLGIDSEPTFTGSPFATANTLPFDIVIGSPGAHDYNVTVRKANAYNMYSRNIYSRTITLDGSGLEVATVITPPSNVTVTDTAGGKALIQATYYDDADSTPGDTWNIYITTDGTDPDPATDTPTQVPMVRWGSIRPAYYLNYTTAAYAHGTDLRVVVTIERSSDSAESTNTAVTTLSIGTAPEPQFDARAWWNIGTSLRLALAPDSTVDETETTDATNGVYVQVTPGVAEFYAGSDLVWRCLYDSQRLDKSFIYIPNTFELFESTYVAATTNAFIETQAWGTPSVLYIGTGIDGDRTRRMGIVLNVASQLRADHWTLPGTMPNVHPSAPIAKYPDKTVFSVYDAYTDRWVPYLVVDDTGGVTTLLSVDMTLTQAAIEAL